MKTLEEIYGDFYSPLHALSYGRPWILSLGSRSIGKSTGWLIQSIYDYLKYGKRFIYLRRTDDEVKMTAPSACDSSFMILRDAGYPIFNVLALKGKFWLYRKEDDENPEEIGMYFSLSQSYKFKSANFGAANYCRIIYDEFINTDASKYLGKQTNITYEYDRCLELYQTVDRGIGRPYRNETQFVFIANVASYYNPVCIGLGVDRYLRTDSKNIAPKGKYWICEQTASVKATDDIRNSYGYLLSDEANRAYAYDSIAFDAKMNFVKRLNCPMQGRFNIKYNDEVYGIYYVPSENCMYMSTRKNSGITIALTTKAQDQIDYTLSIRATDSMYMMTMKKLYYLGKIICENRRARYVISNYFMLTP